MLSARSQQGSALTDCAIVIALILAIAIPSIKFLGWASKDKFVCLMKESGSGDPNGAYGSGMTCDASGSTNGLDSNPDSGEDLW